MEESGNPARLQGTGCVVREPLSWRECLQLAETAEETGYAAVFVPEISSREAFSTLAGFSAVTSSVCLGTGVVTMQSRSPAITAMAAATVQQLSGGRHVLGLGTGVSHAASGEGPVRPVGRLKAYVEVVRQILSGRRVENDTVFGSEGFSLDLEAEVSPPPIWLGALGDRTVGLAGETGDGVLLNWCTPERVALARRTIEESAQRAGRDPASLTIGVYVRACLGVEDAVAVRALQEVTAEYAALPAYRRQFEAMGLGSEADTAAKAFQAGKPETVPFALVDAVTASGSREAASARFDAYRHAGADLVFVYPVPALDPFSSILGTVMAAAPVPSVER